MPPLPEPRGGHILRVKGRPLEFSFWPVEKTTRRYGLGTRVFATDPWTVIRRSVERRCSAPARPAAFALLEQARDFYSAAESGVKAAKPLLLYYCFMNLVKAYLLAIRQRQVVDRAQHGLSEKLGSPPNDRELFDAYLEASKTLAPGPIPTGKIQLFDELLVAVSGTGLPANNFRLNLLALLPQVVPGHRLWASSESGVHERFIAVDNIEIIQAATAKEIWLRVFLFADDLQRIELSRAELLRRTQLQTVLHEVDLERSKDDRSLVCLEQLATVTYGHRPSDSVPALVATLRHKLWRTVLSMPPYRRYYLYPAPPTEHSQVLPQVLSTYAITYYLGSIVRYRPHHFDAIIAGPFGPFIEAFLNDQPAQFIYLMASEFAEKEVTRAAIV